MVIFCASINTNIARNTEHCKSIPEIPLRSVEENHIYNNSAAL